AQQPLPPARFRAAGGHHDPHRPDRPSQADERRAHRGPVRPAGRPLQLGGADRIADRNRPVRGDADGPLARRGRDAISPVGHALVRPARHARQPAPVGGSFLMPRRRRTSGFTLVELLVAATVAALVVGSAGLMLSHVTAAHKRVDRQMRLQQEARAAADAIALALRNAYRPSLDDTADLLGEDGWIGDFPADRIRFYSVSWEPVRRGWPESDVRLVEFFILEPPEDLPDQQPVLMRRLDPTRNPEPDEGGVLDRVAQGVLGLDIAYYDGI